MKRYPPEPGAKAALDRVPCSDVVRVALWHYVDEAFPTGSFLRAVLSDKLHETICAADEQSLAALPAIVRWIYNYAPARCWGSPEKVDAWLEEEKIRGSEKETMKRYHEVELRVRGRGTFPFDMLRYDSACFATEFDTAAATQDQDEERTICLRRFAADPGVITSSEYRWRSYGWRVLLPGVDVEYDDG